MRVTFRSSIGVKFLFCILVIGQMGVFTKSIINEFTLLDFGIVLILCFIELWLLYSIYTELKE